MELKRRKKIWADTKGCCAYCGKFLIPNEKWNNFEIDHIIPRIQNGSNKDYNLVASCISCNKWKGGRSPDEFKEYLIEKFDDENIKLSKTKIYKMIVHHIMTPNQAWDYIMDIANTNRKHINSDNLNFYLERMQEDDEE
jgi:hypothetical protein